MKKINKTVKVFALLCMGMIVSSVANAQVIENMYLNADWQINTPTGNSFADKTSGWGAHGEAGYYITPHITLGGFVSYHSNHKDIAKTTINVNGTEMTSEQEHSVYQVPFGAAFRYVFANESRFEPYIGAKVGANYRKMGVYMDIFDFDKSTWGLYAAPELGLNIYFNPEKKFGVHMAAYYNYTTNDSEVLIYKIDGLSNWGIRLGLAF